MTLRWDWSISHYNEVAHRLHQWQGIYRFNLYNECNLFLSATCFLPGMNLAKASRDQGGDGSKTNAYVHVHYVCGEWIGGGGTGVRTTGERTWGNAEIIGSGKAKRQEVDGREESGQTTGPVMAVGKIAVQGEDLSAHIDRCYSH